MKQVLVLSALALLLGAPASMAQVPGYEYQVYAPQTGPAAPHAHNVRKGHRKHKGDDATRNKQAANGQ